MYRPPFTDHMQTRGNQSITGNHETGAAALLLVIAADLRQHHD